MVKRNLKSEQQQQKENGVVLEKVHDISISKLPPVLTINKNGILHEHHR
jgi:hypothetical protein